jgi:Uma2 family endonuclease
MTPSTQLMTADELLRYPHNNQRLELVKGELRVMPPSGGEHGMLAANICGPVVSYVRTHRLGVVVGAETGFLLAQDPDTVRAPDLGFIRQERIPATGIPRGFWPGAPDLAVEVISPGDTYTEVQEKVEEWLAAGCRLVWVINPRRRTVTVYRSLTDIAILTQADVLDGYAVLPGFRCPVADIFT